MNFTEVAVTNYPVTDFAAARAFYEGVLGLQPDRVIDLKNGCGWAEYEVGDHAFGMGKMEGWLSTPNCALETDDLDAAVTALKNAGTTFRIEPFETPICRMATVIEPGGHVLTIHQRKPENAATVVTGWSAPAKADGRGSQFTEVAFTAYTAHDLAVSRAFYENVLGLKPATVHQKDDGSGWIEYELGSHTFGVGKSPDWSHGVSCALETKDFDGVIAALREAGTPFRMEPFETPVCHMALVSDPSGNKLMIHQRKPGHY
jgi:predicted enzyme related to lactoylglutathione lyase